MLSCGVLLLALGCPSTPPVAAGEAVSECADMPAVSWDGWGRGFFSTWCAACHSATTPDRRGAPDGLDFDTWADVEAHRDRIRATVIDEASMPVGGGLSADDLTLLAALLECGEPGDTTAGSGAIPSPTLDATGVAAAATTAFAGGLPLATTVWAAYLEIIQAHSDGRCPEGGMGEPYSIHAPMVGCVTADGWYFSGLTLRESTTDETGWSEWMLGDGWAHDPDERRLVFGGEIAWGATTDGSSWWQTVSGTWGWEGGADWLAAVPSVSLQVESAGGPDTPTVTVTGGWTIDGQSVFLDALTFTPAVGDTPVAGTVSVRDPAGGWTTLDLADPGGGCGVAVYADGTELGLVCLDTAPLVASFAAGAP